MKRSTIASIVVAMALGFAGCGNNSGDAGKGEVAVVKTNITADKNPAQPPSAAPAKCNSAAAMTLSMDGRKLFNSIATANMERMASGRTDVWPHLSEEDGLTDDSDDISGKKYSSATEYFKVLFDVEGDMPYVDADKDTALANGKSKWCVAQGVTDEMSDSAPLLISANFDCSVLPRTWNGDEANAGAAIQIGTLDKMGDQAIVVIYKGGRSKIIAKEEVSLGKILGTDRIDTLPTSWLTPDGVKEVRR